MEEKLDYEFATGGELVIDVIPTSSSKRSHSAGVALRGTVDSKVGHGTDHDIHPSYPSEKTYYLARAGMNDLARAAVAWEACTCSACST